MPRQRFVLSSTSVKNAREAISAARAGRCDAARRHLKTANLNQSRQAREAQNAARTIVSHLCAGRLDGAKRRRRKKGR